jgi:hypothetical protein
MGVDDANEGHEAGECIEHVWRMRGVTFALGAYADFECTRCGAIRVEQPENGALDAAKRAGIVPGVRPEHQPARAVPPGEGSAPEPSSDDDAPTLARERRSGSVP